MTNMYCQPRCGTTHNPLRLAATRPTGNTSSYKSTKRPRRCAFASSLMNTAATGTSPPSPIPRSEEHTSELQSLRHLVCRLLLEKKKTKQHRGQQPQQIYTASRRAEHKNTPANHNTSPAPPTPGNTNTRVESQSKHTEYRLLITR